MLSRAFSRGSPLRPFTSATSVHAFRRPSTAIPQNVFRMAPARANSSLPPGYVEDIRKGRILRFQESLPRLPVPTLEQTAERYLKSVHPIVTPKEFERTKAAVAEFIKPGGIGEELQKKLQERAANPDIKNWLHEWWNFNAYLGYRDPVVPYVSYFYSYKDDKRLRDPAKRAAHIVTGVLDFKGQVDDGSLEPEYMRKAPICMDSYKYMFNTCRIPEKPADYPIKYSSAENKHFIVIRKNQFFKVMHEVNGQQLTTGELEKQFKQVYQMAAATNAPAIGALTSENRDVWTDARKVLIDASPNNAKSLEVIQSASFAVCLDDTAPVTLEDRAHQYWHGDGKNRFYDIPCQFIINDNGTAGFMGEHSMMDGTPTLRLNDYVCDMMMNNKLTYDTESVRSGLPDPKPVTFTITPAVQETIDVAEKHFRDVIGGHDLRVLQYKGYGKNLIKEFKCSPDAYVQMIIQLAYYKMYGLNRPTYESAATRKYQLGRTETCRSVSEASVEWCKAMNDPNKTDAECIALLRKALSSHVQYISDASEGKGVDRHLFGLKQLVPKGQPLPEVYQDPTYGYSSSWYLSTSQLNSEFFNGYGWSQVIDGGFGIAYMVNNDALQFNIASKKLGADKMHHWLTDAADEMKQLMEKEARAKL